jgi:hypothetical protein
MYTLAREADPSSLPPPDADYVSQYAAEMAREAPRDTDEAAGVATFRDPAKWWTKEGAEAQPPPRTVPQLAPTSVYDRLVQEVKEVCCSVLYQTN